MRCFRITADGTSDAMQIHTQMSCSEFNHNIVAAAALDADVFAIQCSRSRITMLRAFGDFRYPGSIGPGVDDIH